MWLSKTDVLENAINRSVAAPDTVIDCSSYFAMRPNEWFVASMMMRKLIRLFPNRFWSRRSWTSGSATLHERDGRDRDLTTTQLGRGAYRIGLENWFVLARKRACRGRYLPLGWQCPRRKEALFPRSWRLRQYVMAIRSFSKTLTDTTASSDVTFAVPLLMAFFKIGVFLLTLHVCKKNFSQ